MPPAPLRPASLSGRNSSAAPQRPAGRAFFGMLDAVTVESPVDFVFDGAIQRDDAMAVWTWMVRDLAPDLIDIEAVDDTPSNVAALESLMPDLLARVKKTMTDAATSIEVNRRIKSQLGGDEIWERLPGV